MANETCFVKKEKKKSQTVPDLNNKSGRPGNLLAQVETFFLGRRSTDFLLTEFLTC